MVEAKELKYHTPWGDKPDPRADAFLKDLLFLYETHKVSLGHEDGHGSFILEEYSQPNVNWIKHMSVNLPDGQERC